ncbi:Cysteine synthase 3 [Diplonema papillatum]|nr:Cysteine synthase 3 [Diplonema papillatum]
MVTRSEDRLNVLLSHLAVRDTIAKDIVGCIGGTPMVQIRNLCKGLNARVTLKLEYMNPGKSVKDRLGLALINEAEVNGAVSPGKSTLVEATSGNTGIALAMLGAARGYSVILTMPETMSLERRVNLAVYGAQVVLTPSEHGITGAKKIAEQLVGEINASAPHTGHTAYLTQQFSSVYNSAVHKKTTGPEIWASMQGKVDAFVMGVGTGGTTNGMAEFLREKGSKAAVIGVEPAESAALTHLRSGDAAPFAAKPHAIQGIGAGFVPQVLDINNVTTIARVTSHEAVAMARRLACEEGILGGTSSGAIVHAALQLAALPEYAGKDIIAVVPSQGERYLSTILYSRLKEECERHQVVPEAEFPASLALHTTPKTPVYGRYFSEEVRGVHTLAAAVGNTCLVYLNRVCSALPATVAIKMEFENPGKSHADRTALAMILDAEKAGVLNVGDTVVEASTGDIGISLAMLCASKQFKCIICMPENESLEKRVCIRAFGAQLVLTPSKKGMRGAVWKAARIADEIIGRSERAVFMNQFQNMSASQVHYETTGPEIHRASKGAAEIVVLPASSCATLFGVARYFREHRPKTRIVAVQSSANPIFSGTGIVTKAPEVVADAAALRIEGLDVDIVSDHLRLVEGMIDEVISISPADAKAMALRLPAEEGMFGGVQTGACVAAAQVVASRRRNAGKLVVTLACDYGDRYLSTALYSELNQECKELPIVHLGGSLEATKQPPSTRSVWARLRTEASLAAEKSPLVSGFMQSRILDHKTMASAVAETVHCGLPRFPGVDLKVVTTSALEADPSILDAIVVDCWRYSEIDAALAASDFKYLTQFLFYKGHHAIICHRIAHHYWNAGDQWVALLLQSATSRAYAVDIHPQARLGRGMTVDHGTGLVIGGTAVVGKNVQFLHDITLGATGKVGGDRHPKVGDDVILGAHCQVLGNIMLGHGCVVAASAVVNKPVDPYCTVAGIPAKVVKRAPIKQMASFYDPKI